MSRAPAGIEFDEVETGGKDFVYPSQHAQALARYINSNSVTGYNRNRFHAV
jgi:hypothetical protein